MKSNVIGCSPVQGWTNAKFRSWIVSLLRKGTLRYPPRNEVLREARTEKKINPASGRLAQHYKCAECGGEFPMSMMAIDHISPVVGKEGFTTWDNYISRMFCPKENLQALCDNCHLVKSNKEKEEKRDYKN